MRDTCEISKDEIKILLGSVNTGNKIIAFKSHVNNLENLIVKSKMVGYTINTCNNSVIAIIKNEEIVIASDKQIVFVGKKIFESIKAKEITFEGKEFSEIAETTYMFRSCDINKLSIKNMLMPEVTYMGCMFIESVIGTLEIENIEFNKLQTMEWMCASSKTGTLIIRNLNIHTNSLCMRNLLDSSFIIDDAIIDGINVEEINDISEMFQNSKINELNIRGLGIKSLKSAEGVFANASIGKLIVDKEWSKNLEKADRMFYAATINSVVSMQINSEVIKNSNNMFKWFKVIGINLDIPDANKLRKGEITIAFGTVLDILGKVNREGVSINSKVIDLFS